MFELGLAVESVGWSNIIFILNDHFGTYDDLPFDIKTRKAIAFNLSPKEKSNTEIFKYIVSAMGNAIKTCLEKIPKLRLNEITNALKDSEWNAYNFINGKTEISEIKGNVKIKLIHNHIYSFDFESFENHQKYINGDWKARFFINETTLTTAELVFQSSVDFGFKRLVFTLDRKYDELLLIGTLPYGNQVLRRKK